MSDRNRVRHGNLELHSRFYITPRYWREQGRPISDIQNSVMVHILPNVKNVSKTCPQRRWVCLLITWRHKRISCSGGNRPLYLQHTEFSASVSWETEELELSRCCELLRVSCCGSCFTAVFMWLSVVQTRELHHIHSRNKEQVVYLGVFIWRWVERRHTSTREWIHWK